MINHLENPDDTINPEGEDTEDQISQQDVHSDGFEIDPDDITLSNTPDTEGLEAASRASEPSYTLNLDEPPAKPKPKE